MGCLGYLSKNEVLNLQLNGYGVDFANPPAHTNGIIDSKLSQVRIVRQWHIADDESLTTWLGPAHHMDLARFLFPGVCQRRRPVDLHSKIFFHRLRPHERGLCFELRENLLSR